MRLSRCALFTSALAMSGVPAAAQSGASDELVPRRLVEALLGGIAGSGRPELIVGSLPPTVQAKVVIPAGAKVLGGVNLGEMAFGVLTLDGPLNAAADAFSRELLRNGWEVMDQGPDMFYGSEFIDAGAAQRRPVSGAPEIYCGRAGTLNVRYTPDGFNQTRVTVMSLGDNQCAQRRDAMLRSRGPGSREPSRPILVNPGAARNQRGLCPDFNMGMGGRGTELNSRMAPEEILADYAKQMSDSGWTRNGTGVSASWTKTDTAGVVTEYQVTVRTAAESPMCRKVDSQLRARSR